MPAQTITVPKYIGSHEGKVATLVPGTDSDPMYEIEGTDYRIRDVPVPPVTSQFILDEREAMIAWRKANVAERSKQHKAYKSEGDFTLPFVFVQLPLPT